MHSLPQGRIMQSDHELEQDEETVSKSQRKRDMQAVQDLVQKLLDFPEEKVVKTGIDHAVLEAMAVARKMKKEGQKRGVSDLFLAYPHGSYCGLWIELKKLDGKNPTDDQMVWIIRKHTNFFNIMKNLGS